MQKEKLGREVDGHKDIPTISKLFTDELGGIAVAQAKADSNESKLQVCDTLAMRQKGDGLVAECAHQGEGEAAWPMSMLWVLLINFCWLDFQKGFMPFFFLISK